jgi:hypothetical protein
MNCDKKFRLVLHIIIPAACCIVLGFIAFGGMIFERHMTMFQIIISGILASLFLAVLKFTSMKNSLAIIFVVILFEEVFITKPAGMDYIIRDAAYLGSLVISVLIFYKQIYKKAAPSLYPLFSVITFAVVYAVCLTIFLLYKSLEYGSSLGSDLFYLPFQILIYSIIGLGIGAGTFFADKYLPLIITEPEESAGNDNT